jgi:hypothetical protein
VAPITPKGYWDSGWCLLLELPKGTIYQGTPFFKISIFVPLYIFFGIFFYKIGIYDPDLIWGLYFWAVTQWEGGLILEGPDFSIMVGSPRARAPPQTPIALSIKGWHHVEFIFTMGMTLSSKTSMLIGCKFSPIQQGATPCHYSPIPLCKNVLISE